VKEVIAVIRPERWEATRKAVSALEVEEVLHQRVLGRGRQRGLRYLRPATGEEGGMTFLSKRLVVWAVPNALVDRLVAAVVLTNQTGNIGDGKIFVCPLEEAADSSAESPNSRV
jgi:nitrogen regulatory protein PII 2